ncbi:hypothetical protein ACMD2_25295 [Ananas comosus]|uniref:MLLE-like domain-containing protein n=1 Tax=Ananas comosus TaxID=4615 RepID=A0A199V7W9_ANACO|nr:hypothetical protein ACMD2_25295 [Ananas comosus]
MFKELAADLHWKGENGFRNGYFGRLEKMIAERLRGCGLRASPHIESTVKYLKQKYCAITEILSKTGMHEFAKGLWGIPFPHLDILAEINEKDWATRGVEAFVDAVHNIETEEANHMLAYIGGGGPNVGDNDNDNETHSAERTASSSSRKAKKQSVKEKEAKDPLQKHVELFSRTLGPFIPRMEAHFATMANVMTREQKMAEKSTAENNTTRVVAELLALRFNNNQIIKATDIFAAEPSKMNVLFSLPRQLKRQYMLDILNLSVGEPKAGSTSKQL